MTTFAPALHLQNDNIHTKIKAQMIIKDPGSSITHFIGMLCAIAGLFPLILKAASYGTARVFNNHLSLYLSVYIIIL